MTVDAVTGAFSYTGRAIAEELLARGRGVRTLSRRPDPAHPLAARVDWTALDFLDEPALRQRLEGVDVLYNTYWIRFEHGGSTFARAVRNIGVLARAARDAGVRRIVHVSVANPSQTSPFPYYRGKAAAEAAVAEAGLSHAIVRPTLIYGASDILVNNIAWTVRRFPFFAIAARGAFRVQPVAIGDVAAHCVTAGERAADETFDVAGPEIYRFDELVRLIGAAGGRTPRLVSAPGGVVLALGRVVGACKRDILLTRDELGALEAELLVSQETPTATGSFAGWLGEHGAELGLRYTSELARNFRPYAPL